VQTAMVTTMSLLRTPRACALVALYAAAVLAVPMVFGPRTGTGGEHATEPAVRDSDSVRAVSGIWWRYEQGVEGDPVRFYYFHGDGKGLYRYGRIGHTNTHSFDYDVQGDRLTLAFRKSGERHVVRFEIERGEGRDWMTLHDDPREPLREEPTRYFRESEQTIRGPAVAHPAPQTGPAPAGHMWIDQTRYATGGYGFSFYQFRPAGIDGRGVGWHHRGDFDDWSTESLTYRISGDRLELWFPLTNEHHTTRFFVTQAGDERRLTLYADPRDFWHAHTYLDIGVSFGSHAITRARDPLDFLVSTAGLAETLQGDRVDHAHR
jgi:hypothetical protein